MTKIAIVPNAAGTGTFTIEAPNSNSNRTLVLPDEAGTVLTTATAGVPVNGPAFRAFKNAVQTVSSSTFTKVTLPSKEFDTASAFDSVTNHRFQPAVAGYYQVNGKLVLSSTQNITRAIVSIRWNGIETNSYGRGQDLSNTTSFITFSVSDLFYLNGSTDFLELWVYADTSGTLSVNSTDANTSVLSGALVRSA